MIFGFLAMISDVVWPILLDPMAHQHDWKKVHVTTVEPLSFEKFKGSPETLRRLIRDGKGSTEVLLSCHCGATHTVSMEGT